MKLNKRVKVLLGLSIITSSLIVGCGVSEEEQNMIDNYPKLETKIKELESKVEEAKPYFTMSDEEKRKLDEEAKRIEEENKKQEELEQAKKESGIGITQYYTMGDGDFTFTIDNVKLTSERNQFADPVKYVVQINYTVENTSMSELDFFLSNQATFYDGDGYKCTSYPNSSGAGTYDIATGKKASGVEFIGIEESDAKYLEMEIAGDTFKWVLE